MRVFLAQLSPVRGDSGANLDRIESVVRQVRGDLVAFPELFLSGYRVGDEIHRLAVEPNGPELKRLATLARRRHVVVVVGGPYRRLGRGGEVENVAFIVSPDREVAVQSKRYLPNFGPFEEGLTYAPSDSSTPTRLGSASVGFQICYDAFFPEVARELALGGAQLIVNISASPVTSRSLFDRILPARAIENGIPVAYVNRVGVEDGLVFGGGSAVWDPRGELVPGVPARIRGLSPEESVNSFEIDLLASERWRPMRPVLRDVRARPPPSPKSGPAGKGRREPPQRSSPPVKPPSKIPVITRKARATGPDSRPATRG